MTTLRDAAQRVIDLHDMDYVERMRQFSHKDDWLLACRRARDVLRSKLAQEPVAGSLTEDERAATEYFTLNPSVAVLAFSHWLHRDKSAPPQPPAQPVQEDAAMSAALGWPGGISDPVLDRTSMLQMVTTLPRQKALEGLAPQMRCWCEDCDVNAHGGLRTRMSVCPECGDKRCRRAAHHDFPCSTKPSDSLS